MSFRLISERSISDREIRARSELFAMLRDGVPRRLAITRVLRLFALTSIPHWLLPNPTAANPSLINAIIDRLRVPASVRANANIRANIVLRNETSRLEVKPFTVEHEDPTGIIIAQDSRNAEIKPRSEVEYEHTRFVAVASSFGRNEYLCHTGIDDKSAPFAIT